MQRSTQGQLDRQLHNRHVQLIALGGTIGTGLFLGSAGIIEMAGPAALVAYGIGGLVIFLIMRFLGEMLVEEPVAGSFSHFANRYCGPFTGFLSGWTCVALYVLVGMIELTAVGKFIQFWWPQVPVWATAAVCFVLINALNFVNVRAFGEFEFWFALIKVVTVVAMIVMGCYLLFSSDRPDQSFSNLWTHGGFAPKGLGGITMALAFVLFAFGGIETIGFAAAETEQPEKVIPTAINQVILRVLVFYIGSLVVLLSLTPWNQLVAQLTAGGDPYAKSPFVQVFASLGQGTAAHLLNFVILTAALSVYNSMVYCTSRLLYGMAREGNAPRLLTQVNRRGVPVPAIVFPGILTAVTVLLNYVMPSGVIEALLSLIVGALVVTWMTIIITHWRFRRARAQAALAKFPAPVAPVSNLFCLAVMALVLGVMLSSPEVRLSALALPVWIAVIYGVYRFLRRT
ncbi:aromatic amino acid transport protein AroP [Roseateles sp. YR242]|uniref:amino acid permease n=1 Tax=Roseateles sp. YR242 TaxID=1855305 RepID=UPI0008B8D270|nr:amino acid permease [Roseateles sp. YR242]SEL82742.1 aromatic amino acid transport protein AroP [Roseateles sp. YR242]